MTDHTMMEAVRVMMAVTVIKMEMVMAPFDRCPLGVTAKLKLSYVNTCIKLFKLNQEPPQLMYLAILSLHETIICNVYLLGCSSTMLLLTCSEGAQLLLTYLCGNLLLITLHCYYVLMSCAHLFAWAINHVRKQTCTTFAKDVCTQLPVGWDLYFIDDCV